MQAAPYIPRKEMPQASTYHDIQQNVWEAKQAFPLCRVGQAFCNTYQVPRELETKIWELDNYAKVVTAVLSFKGV